MIDFSYQDRLIHHPFRSSHYYNIAVPSSTSMYFKSQSIPYIMCNVAGRIQNFYDDDSEIPELCYANISQFRGRKLDRKKLEEVFNTCMVPIIVRSRSGDNLYIVAKGFIATKEEKPQLLFVATADHDSIITNKVQVTFYISKAIYTDNHAGLLPIIQKSIKEHTGDIITCNSIEEYICRKIEIPNFKTLGERSAYTDKLIDHCIEKCKIDS